MAQALIDLLPFVSNTVIKGERHYAFKAALNS